VGRLQFRVAIVIDTRRCVLALRDGGGKAGRKTRVGLRRDWLGSQVPPLRRARALPPCVLRDAGGEA
jgi:hypothetical protein